MSVNQVTQDHAGLRGEIDRVRQEVVVLQSQLAGLARENSRGPKLLQTLSGHLGFGAAGPLEWPRFKLKLKQQELVLLEAHYEKLGVSDHRPRPATQRQIVPAGGRAGETARQKMERLIEESPGALVPYIRRIYRPIIEAEESPEG